VPTGCSTLQWAGMLLLAIRRGLIEETNATSSSELVLIDMAVIDFRERDCAFSSMIGNTALLIESEMFGAADVTCEMEEGVRRTTGGYPGASCRGARGASFAISSWPLAERSSAPGLGNISRRSARMSRQPAMGGLNGPRQSNIVFNQRERPDYTDLRKFLDTSVSSISGDIGRRQL